MKKARIAGITMAIALVVMTMAVQPAAANPGTRLESLYGFLVERYDDDGERGFTRIGQTISRNEPTYSAAVALDALGYFDARPPPFDLLKMKNFTQKLQWIRSLDETDDQYGSMADFIAGSYDIHSTFMGIQTWFLLSQQDTDIPGMEDVTMNLTATLVYVNKTHNEDGGFGRAEGEDSDLLSTYHAVSTMDTILEAVSEEFPEQTWSVWLPNATATVEWILKCREGNGFKISPDSRVSGVTSTASALLALDILDALPQISDDIQDIADWIGSLQVEQATSMQYVGGWTEGANTNDTNIMSTYYALLALNLLDAIDSQVNQSIAVDFILDCQATDGSWGFTPEREVGNIAYVGRAIRSLEMLDQNLNQVLAVEDPNNPAPVLLDWRIVAVIAITVGAVVIAIVSVRMD
jgi:prenyltransferase beta subunit